MIGMERRQPSKQRGISEGSNSGGMVMGDFKLHRGKSWDSALSTSPESTSLARTLPLSGRQEAWGVSGRLEVTHPLKVLVRLLLQINLISQALRMLRIFVFHELMYGQTFRFAKNLHRANPFRQLNHNKRRNSHQFIGNRRLTCLNRKSGTYSRLSVLISEYLKVK